LSSNTDPSENPNKPKNKQAFVKIRFEPGEWDGSHSDPLYLPPFHANPANKRVISEEDFLNRPTAGFSEEFATMADARITFTWMNHDVKEQIYKDYVQLMETMYAREEHNVTSHEYVIHVIARKYRIMPDRAAAIVELWHNQEQLKRTNPERVFPELGRLADQAMQRFITDVYAQYNEPRPPEGEFWEMLLERDRRTYEYQDVGDEFDVDTLEKEAILGDREFAQRLIDNKIYIEDDDPASVILKVSKDCNQMISKHETLKEEIPSTLDVLGENAPFPALKEKEKHNPPARRKEWKWVCNAINTREAKKLRNTPRDKTLKKLAQNTLVNHEGVLRPATQEELNQVAWKPKRPLKEALYRNAKQGWIAKIHRGQAEAWGPAKNWSPVEIDDRPKKRLGGGSNDNNMDNNAN